MPEEIVLTEQELQLIATVKHEVIKLLEARIEARVRESILRLRGDLTEEQRSEVREQIISEIKSNTKRMLEI
jgi:hypothetical protein